MSTITQKSFFALLFLASSLFSWAKTSSVSDDKLPYKSGTIAVPTPPTIIGATPESCGYQFANDPTSFVKLVLSGCEGRTPKWYDSNGIVLAEGKNPFFISITADKTVYATCTDGDGESLPSAPVVAKYVKAPPTAPSITIDGDSKYSVKCEGQLMTLKSSETNPSYVYEWIQSPTSLPGGQITIFRDGAGYGYGQGTSTLTTAVGGSFHLMLYSPECPAVKRYATNNVYANFLTNPSKPKITGSAKRFGIYNCLFSSDQLYYVL